jgi:hypothetical protein
VEFGFSHLELESLHLHFDFSVYCNQLRVIFKCLASFELSTVHFRMPCVGPRLCIQASALGAGDVCILYTTFLTGHCARNVVLWFTGSLHDELFAWLVAFCSLSLDLVTNQWHPSRSLSTGTYGPDMLHKDSGTYGPDHPGLTLHIVFAGASCEI